MALVGLQLFDVLDQQGRVERVGVVEVDLQAFVVRQLSLRSL
jgi:hypothetical protein